MTTVKLLLELSWGQAPPSKGSCRQLPAFPAGGDGSAARKRLICEAPHQSDNLIYGYVAALDKGTVAFSFQHRCGHHLIIPEKVESIKTSGNSCASECESKDCKR